MARGMMTAALQQIDEAHDVGVHIGVGIFKGIAHTGLSRQVDHHVKGFAAKKVVHRGTVGQIDLRKGKPLPGFQLFQAVALQVDVVVVVEVVQSHHLDAVIQQAPGQVKTDEAGRSRNEDMVEGIGHEDLLLMIVVRAYRPRYQS